MGDGDRRVGRARARVAGDVAGDQPHERAAVGRRQQRDLVALEVLVAGRDHLVLGRQVDPQLHAVEEPAADDQLLGRRLDVEDAAAGRHPLGGAVGDDAAAAVGVLVLERAVDDVGDGLEAAVRVPVGAPRLAGRVVDLAHLVHVDERVEVGQVDAGEGPADREALALEPAGAVVTERTGRSWASAVGAAILGSVSVSAVTAGICVSLVASATTSTG